MKQEAPTSIGGSSSPGEDRYLDFSAKTLEAFSRFVRDFPMASFSYGVSLYAFLRGIYKVETRDYFDELLRAYRPFKFVLRSHVEGVVVCEGQSCKIFNDLKELML